MDVIKCQPQRFCLLLTKETNKNPSHNLALYKAVLAGVLCYLSKKYGSKKKIMYLLRKSDRPSDGLGFQKLGFGRGLE